MDNQKFPNKTRYMITVTSQNESLAVQKKLFELGYGFFCGAEIKQEPLQTKGVSGVLALPSGNITLLLNDEDDTKTKNTIEQTGKNPSGRQFCVLSYQEFLSKYPAISSAPNQQSKARHTHFFKKLDYNNPPMEGFYWVALSSPEITIDVNDEGEIIGTPDEESEDSVSLAFVYLQESADGGLEFDPVDTFNLGDIPFDARITHYLPESTPTIETIELE